MGMNIFDKVPCLDAIQALLSTFEDLIYVGYES